MSENIFDLVTKVRKIINLLVKDSLFWKKIGVKDTSLSFVVFNSSDVTLGDFSSNVLKVLLAKVCNKNEVRENFKKEINANKGYVKRYISSINFKNDYLNLKMTNSFWGEYLEKISSLTREYGCNKSIGGNGYDLILEYVSANPTGPLHLGHLRGGFIGDVLARIKEWTGAKVLREYYVNDRGVQFDKFIAAVFYRSVSLLVNSLHFNSLRILIEEKFISKPYLEEFLEKICLEEYQGAYINCFSKNLLYEIEKNFSLLKLFTSVIINLSNSCITSENLINFLKDGDLIKLAILKSVIAAVRRSLRKINIKHDVFIYERNVLSNFYTEACNLLNKKGFLYKDYPPTAISKKFAMKDKPQKVLLFRSSLFGDERDRPIEKSDGEKTYLASDIAYFYKRMKTSYCLREIITVLGADHSAYVKPFRAIADSLSNGRITSKIVLYQWVGISKGGKSLKFSKRLGNIITLDDFFSLIRKSIGEDVFRSLSYLPDKIDIYTDGSGYKGKGKLDSGCAFVVYSGQGEELYQHSSSFSDKTNNAMEITAVNKALLFIKKQKVRTARIFSDSEYVVKGVNCWSKTWDLDRCRKKDGKFLKNCILWRDLLKNLDDLKKEISIEILHIPAHKGNEGNEKADNLSRISLNSVDKLIIDSLRYLIISKGITNELNIELDNISSMYEGNPLFYPLYAYTRCISVMRKNYKEKPVNKDIFFIDKEIEILQKIFQWPKTLLIASKNNNPQLITTFMTELSGSFHRLYSYIDMKGKKYSFKETTYGKYLLLSCLKKTLKAGFSVLNIDPVEKL